MLILYLLSLKIAYSFGTSPNSIVANPLDMTNKNYNLYLTVHSRKCRFCAEHWGRNFFLCGFFERRMVSVKLCVEIASSLKHSEVKSSFSRAINGTHMPGFHTGHGVIGARDPSNVHAINTKNHAVGLPNNQPVTTTAKLICRCAGLASPKQPTRRFFFAFKVVHLPHQTPYKKTGGLLTVWCRSFQIDHFTRWRDLCQALC